MKYNFDLISDVHLDFYIDIRHPELKMRKRIKEFVESIVPKEPQNTLVIAGDLGHYNHQNMFLLEELKKYYKYIILVSGNHDYYLVSSNVQSKYKNDSKKRISEMKEKASKIEGVYYLDGDAVELDGVIYGGVGMWYDFSYGRHMFGKSQTALYSLWKEVMNDSSLIKGLDFGVDFNEAVMSKEKIDSITNYADVIITHVGPEWSKIPNEYKDDLSTSFYYFDGSPYFDRIKDKVWVYGHVHYRNDYIAHDCRFVNASLGYPSENKNRSRKIVNVVDANPWI